MNSLLSSFRLAVRAQPARSFTPALTSSRAYSTPATPADPSSSSSPADSPSAFSSSPGPLDALLKDVQANKPSRRPKPAAQPMADMFARKGPAHGALNDFLTSTPTSYDRFSPASSPRPSTPDEIWRRQENVSYSLPVTTTSSRSFPVVNRNVAQAYRNLNRVMQDNNIKRELKRQERFEGPSDKRVRLNSERHRRRFKVAVGRAVSLAMRQKDL